MVHDGGRAAYQFKKPLIAAVNGIAYGAGLSLALSADILVAAEDARLCEVFAKVGGCPDTGSSWLLQQRARAGVARMLVFTGREIDGRTAHELRVVQECVPTGEVESWAIEIAQEIAAHPAFGMLTAKRVLRAAAECSYLGALDIERDAQSVLLCAHDFPKHGGLFSALISSSLARTSSCFCASPSLMPQPVMSIKAVNSLSHYTDWTIGHVHSGALWLGCDGLLRCPVGRLADPSLPADLLNRGPVFTLPDDERLRRVRELRCLHGGLSSVQPDESHRKTLVPNEGVSWGQTIATSTIVNVWMKEPATEVPP